MKAIAVAVFVKDDLIQQQIDNLLATDHIDEYSVYFYQDSIDTNSLYNTQQYIEQWNAVSDIIKTNLARFKSAKFFRSEMTRYPFGICQLALDTAFAENDFCIFMEDDIFLSKNALNWFNYVYNNNMLTWDTYKFCTGESSFFDTSNKDVYPSPEMLTKIKNIVNNRQYFKHYYEISHFLTSSIFATTKAIWNTEIREVRGRRWGPNLLNELIDKNKWKSLFPFVPVAKDIGMLHRAGWSIACNGISGVTEIKNTYLMADEFETPDKYEELPKSVALGSLYSLFSKLEGIDEIDKSE